MLLVGVVAGLPLVALSLRRQFARLASETERLHDEVWELREAAAARDKAEAANEAKSRFLATVSHEVRTPLSGILGMADLLGHTALDGEQATYVAAIHNSGAALAALIDEILDFSKIESGRLDLAAESFDLVTLVQGVTELLAPRAQGKGLEIASTLAVDVPQRVVGDAARLRQILLNVAGNAVKFTERGGVGIAVSCDDKGGLRFDIADTGPGVPEDRRDAIFEEFEQADSSTTRAHGGTGLGLAISRRLAEFMGGTLDLAEPARPPAGDGARPERRGALFSLVLPLAAATFDTNAHPGWLAGRSALIVADSPFEAPFLADRLSEVGVAVARASTAEDAVTWLSARTGFDIVIVDCALGEVTARTVGAAARAAGVGQCLSMFSPFERRALAQDMACAFDGWLVKPVRLTSLFQRLDPARVDERPGPVAVATFADAPGLNVLLAEDNDINALLATRHLERCGARVTRAADGFAALHLAEAAMDRREPFDAVVLDIRMPGLDGLEVARRIRIAEGARHVKRARLIALSADVIGAGHRNIRETGVDLFLAKPVSIAQIQRALRGSADLAEARAG